MTTDRHMQVAAELLEAAQKRAAQAEADRDTLAAEVGAWRTPKMRNNPNTMEKVIVFTNKSGALQRAKEAK